MKNFEERDSEFWIEDANLVSWLRKKDDGLATNETREFCHVLVTIIVTSFSYIPRVLGRLR